MKKILSILVFVSGVGGTIGAFAQDGNVGIGTKSPDNSAVLDIQSPTKGLLIPRMTLEQRNAIQSPATGLLVFQTGESAGFFFFNGQKWSPLSENDAKSVANDPNDWTANGNSVATGATTPYFGTNSASDLLFAAGGRIAGYISNGIANENIFLGLNAGRARINNSPLGYSSVGTGVGNTALGSNSLASLLNGADNIAIGIQAAYGNTDGTGNLAIGSQSLRTNTNGMRNVAIGKTALYALNGTSGLPGVATGSDNLAFGSGALETLVTGTFNTAIGVEAGYYSKGSNSLYLGGKAGPAATTTENNVMYINNARTDAPLVFGDFAANYLAIGAVTPAERTAAFSLAGGYRLLVKGGLLTEKVKVALATTGDWSDYVFEPNYKRMPLEEVEKFVKLNKHLPNVPSAEEMVKGGLDVAKSDAKLLEKIEELTLYVIELNKEVKALKAKK
jgi:hypothetical protein